VSIAAVDQEISDVKGKAKRDKEVAKVNDALANLNTDKKRLVENQRLGISNPKLEAIDFNQERAALVGRKQTAESNYQQRKAANATDFQGTVNTQNEKSRQLVDKETQRVKVDALETKLKNAPDEPTKVKIQFEIDQTKLTSEVEKTKGQLQESLNTLRERQQSLGDIGIIDPDLNKLIGDVEKLIAQADDNKNAAFKVLASQALIKAALAETVEARQKVSTTDLLYSPGVDLAQQQSKNLIAQGQFREAAVPGRAAAIGNEDLRYYKQKADFSYQVAKTRAGGTQIPQQQVDSASQAIDKLHGINLASITQEFDTLSNSINASTSALQKLARSEVQGFITELISGTKSFNEIWQSALNNIVQGMIKILAQKFTDQLFDGGGKGSNAGILGGAVNFIGGILGFADGGLIPGGQGHEAFGNGSGAIAAAIRREGQGATVIVGKRGERILNLPETAAYHQKFPNGILNYDRGGIIGGNSSSLSGGNFSGLGGLLNGKFDVNLQSDGKSQPAVNDQLGPKFTQAIRGVIANEIRDGGILNRFVR
jgi:hypothetical protein